jgi:hypothetical protein
MPHGRDIAAKTYACMRSRLSVQDLVRQRACGAHIPEQLLGALALRLRLEEPVQRRQGASEAPAVPTAPISMSLSFARLPEVDLPWSDHVLSECEGTTQMAVSRRSGQRGKREEPIGPFPHRRVAAASGHPTLNMAAHSEQPVHRRRGPAVTRSARLPRCRVGMNCTPPGDVAESMRLSAHRSENRRSPTRAAARCGTRPSGNADYWLTALRVVRVAHQPADRYRGSSTGSISHAVA